MRKFLSFFLVSVLTTFSGYGKSNLELKMDGFLAENEVNWSVIENSVFKQLKAWGEAIYTGDKAAALKQVLANSKAIFKEIMISAEANKVIHEFNKIDGFHPEGEFIWGSVPTSWWMDVYKQGDGDEFIDRQSIQNLQRRSIEGRIDPVTICNILNLGTDHRKLNDPGLQKFVICIVYPFLLPTEKNLAERKAEQELKDIVSPIFDSTFNWEMIRAEFMDYIDTNYKNESVKTIGQGGKIRFMLNQVADTDKIIKWNQPELKSALVNSQMIKGDKTNYDAINDLLNPIIVGNPELHKFHPIKGAYDVTEALILSDLSVGILAGGLAINWSEMDFEKDEHLQLLFILSGGNLF